MYHRNGSLVGPYWSMDDVKAVWGEYVRLLPRFPIWEQRGGSLDPSCRNIDNGPQGGENALAATRFTNRPADLDQFVGMIRHFMELFAGLTLLGFTSDFKSAYRQCTACPGACPALGPNDMAS